MSKIDWSKSVRYKGSGNVIPAYRRLSYVGDFPVTTQTKEGVMLSHNAAGEFTGPDQPNEYDLENVPEPESQLPETLAQERERFLEVLRMFADGKNWDQIGFWWQGVGTPWDWAVYGLDGEQRPGGIPTVEVKTPKAVPLTDGQMKDMHGLSVKYVNTPYGKVTTVLECWDGKLRTRGSVAVSPEMLWEEYTWPNGDRIDSLHPPVPKDYDSQHLNLEVTE